MLDRVFLSVLNMSLTGGFVILLVLAARLLLRHAPRRYSCLLWAVVGLRLICPLSLESLRSILPVVSNPLTKELLYSPTPQVSTGMPGLDAAVNAFLPAPAGGASVNPMQVVLFCGEMVWLAGIVVLLLCGVLSVVRLRRRLVGAVLLHDNIFLADHIATPFVFGGLRPAIYLPSSLSESSYDLILRHEQTHIRRLDYLVKPVACLIVMLHWFNPLVWLALFWLSRDMETACDERVMEEVGEEAHTAYASLLLELATGRREGTGCSLAFGEGDTRSRVKHVLHYRRPARWVSVLAALLAALVCVAGCVSRAIEDTGIASDGTVLTFPLEEGTLEVSLPLPDGWAASPVYVDERLVSYRLFYRAPQAEEALYCGEVSASSADWIEEGRSNYRMYYQGYMLGSLVSWDFDYTAVVEGKNEAYGSATCSVGVSQAESATSSAAANTVYYPGVLAYSRDGDLIRQVAIRFEPGSISRTEQTAVAAGISLTMTD